MKTTKRGEQKGLGASWIVNEWSYLSHMRMGEELKEKHNDLS